MQSARTVLDIIRNRGERGLPVERLYRQLFNPQLYLLAYGRICANKGAMTPGVTAETADGMSLEKIGRIIDALRAERYRWSPARRVYIEKKGSRKKRPLGLPPWSDKLVAEVVRLLLEAYYDVQFSDRSHGFRPRRGCHTALTDIARTWRGVHWFIEGDISDCFDTIDHTALMDRVRRRVGDNRVLALVKAFLKAGILGEDGALRDTRTGTPQGGILSPLLANVALAVLDEYVDQAPGGPNSTQGERARRKRQGKANFRLVRYADDFLVLVAGDRDHAEELRAEVAKVLAPMGLRLSVEKTKITHIDEGLDFLGWRIQRHTKRGTNRQYVYTYPSKKALHSAMGKVKEICRKSVNLSLPALLHELNPVLRGWCAYFRPGVSSATFQYLSHYTWETVIRWARRKHHKANWKTIRRIYCRGGWWPVTERGELFNPAKVATTRYPYRGTAIPGPWPVAG